MERKEEIKEFDPAVYPFRLWVSIKPSKDLVTERFYALTTEMDRVDIDDRYFDKDRFTIASASPVTDKKTGWIGVLVFIWKPSSLDVKTICHESSHCADYICDQFGISNGSFDHGEARAYLQGWIAECIEKVKKTK